MDMGLVRKILVEFIREEVVRRRGFEGVVMGVSGGVDSAVALYLAVEALGPENVTGFRLPYATSSPESLEHAGLVLSATGAESRTIDITPSVDAYVSGVDPELSDLRRGNLAARLRGVTLFDQSAKLRRLPLGTGNKSERLLGYFTWHADDSPPINPLGDLFKTQVWELARHLGVPDVIVDKPASADLIRGIHDEDELGVSYREADPILYWLLSGYRPEELLVVRLQEGGRGGGLGPVQRHPLEAGASHRGGPFRNGHRGVLPAARGLLTPGPQASQEVAGEEEGRGEEDHRRTRGEIPDPGEP